MKLYVMHRLLGNGGFDLFFLFANISFWLWMCVFLLLWKRWKAQYKPMVKGYPISFNLEGGLSDCLAVYNYLFIPFVIRRCIMYRSSKIFLWLLRFFWTLQSVFSEYNSQKQLWKYLKVLSSFFLTSWLILNKFFLFFLIDKGEGEQGKSYKCVSLYVNMVSSVTCAFHFNF